MSLLHKRRKAAIKMARVRRRGRNRGRGPVIVRALGGVGLLSRSPMMDRVGEHTSERFAESVARTVVRRCRVQVGTAVVAAAVAMVVAATVMESFADEAVVAVAAFGVVAGTVGVANALLNRGLESLVDAIGEFHGYWKGPQSSTTRFDAIFDGSGGRTLAAILLLRSWPHLPVSYLTGAMQQRIAGIHGPEVLDAAMALADGWDGTVGELVEVALAVATGS